MTVDLTCSQTVYGIPRSHHHCSFDNYRWPNDAVQGAVVSYLESLERGEKRNLLLTGSPGLGKTHLCVAAYRWGVYRWGTADCVFLHVPLFLDEVKRGFGKESVEDAFEEIEGARRLVVLDDLLGRNPSSWELDNVIFRLINISYTHRVPTLVTANHSLEQFSDILKPHEVSRLLDRTKHIAFIGRDERLRPT